MSEQLPMLSIADLGVTNKDFVASSWSGGNGGNCAELAIAPAGVAVRDSKLEASPVLVFRREAFAPFLGELVTNGPA